MQSSLEPLLGPESIHRPAVSALARIAQGYHDAQRAELDRLAEFLASARREGGVGLEVARALENILDTLRRTLLAHLDGTAAALFSHAAALEAGAEVKVAAHTAAHLIVRLRSEHATVRALLQSACRTASEYVSPSGTLGAAQGLYGRLATWKRDAQEHAALENELLVARILTLDPSIERDMIAVTLSVHRREIHSNAGQRQTLTVFCPADRQSLALELCHRCPLARRVTEASVLCSLGVEPPSRVAFSPRLGDCVPVGEAVGTHSVSVVEDVHAKLVVQALTKDSATVAIVVDAADHLLGILERDRAECAPDALTAGELKQKSPFVDESASLADAIACMTRAHARFLPIVGNGGKVVGMLADTDALLWVAAQRRHGE